MSKILGPFWSYVNKTSTCWLWCGTIGDNGYGYYGRTAAHVVSWGKPVKAGHELHHKCLIKRCVRQDHLEEVTKLEHKNRHKANRTSCPNGHPLSESITVDRGRKHCIKCSMERRRSKSKKGKLSEAVR